MTNGLAWRKCDLHLHTPASNDFPLIATPEQIVEKALSENLDAIAITDHNTGDWIDKVKEAAKETDLVVFPGVEITCNGGKRGIHILALFDPEKGTKDVNGLLDAIGIDHVMRQRENQPKTVVPNKYSLIDVVEEIHNRNGLAIPAHVNSKKGLLTEMQGEQKFAFFEQCKHILAVEATDINSDPKNNTKNTKDWFDGTDQYYPKLAVYQASDNPHKKGHCIETIGSRVTYFKLDVINLEGLRQCFIHPDARITIDLEENSYPRIISLKINGDGFLGTQAIQFHEGLNSIIGGKGVGKSLLIEFLRFGMCAPSLNESLYQDHIGKLDKQLGLGNSVEIIYRHSSGTKYKIERVYQGKSGKNDFKSDTNCFNLDKNELYEGNIAEVLPILAYSQTEVIKISEDKRAQLKLIDGFIDETEYKNKIESLNNQLSDNDRLLAKSRLASERLEQIELEIKTVSAQIEEVNKLVNNELFKKMKQAEQKMSLIEQRNTIPSSIKNDINEWISRLESHKLNTSDSSKNADKEISSQAELITKQIEDIEIVLNSLLIKADETIDRSKSIKETWKFTFDKLKAEYDELLKNQGGNQQELENNRRKLENRKSELDLNADKERKDADDLGNLLEVRNKLLDQLERVYKQYFELRANKFTELTEASDGRLKLDLIYAKNGKKYESALVDILKGGDNAPSTAMRKSIAKKIPPRELIDIFLNNNESKLCEDAEITTTWGSRVMAKLSSADLEEVLHLQHAYQFEDVPEIKYKRANGEFAALDELSVGQKCTALLIIALAEGTIPIIIDQPEDALDIISVWDDVAKKLLEFKKSRQFILTTHNSSVAVSADSDQFIVLKADANQATIATKGAIDRDEVKQEVIDHLEGGDDSYALRNKKLQKN